MTLGTAVLDLLFPPKCPFCHRVLDDPRAPVCPACQPALPWLEGVAGEQIGVQQPDGQQAQGVDQPFVEQIATGQEKRSFSGDVGPGRTYS